MSDPLPRLLVSAQEAAAMLGVSPNKVRELDRTGRMPAPVHLGRRVLWSVQALERWIENGTPRREP